MDLTVSCKQSTQVERLLRSLIKRVPLQNLSGLSKIEILDSGEPIRTKNSKKENVRGVYYRKTKNSEAKIQLFLDEIFGNAPGIFFYLPFLPKFMLARVLYHEIGHHCHRTLSHSVPDKRTENYAEKYYRKMMLSVFKPWFYVLLPLRPLLKLIGKKRGSEENQ